MPNKNKDTLIHELKMEIQNLKQQNEASKNLVKKLKEESKQDFQENLDASCEMRAEMDQQIDTLAGIIHVLGILGGENKELRKQLYLKE